MANDEKPVAPATTAPMTKQPRGEKAGGKAGGKEVRLDDFIAAVHRMAANVADAGIFAKHGVTIAEWSMLKAMGDKTEVSLKEVGKRARVSRQRLRALLADLEKKGFVTIAKTEGDKRARAVTILPKSAEVVATIARDFDAMAQENPSLSKASGRRLAGAVRVATKLGQSFQRAERGEGAARGEGARVRAVRPDRAVEKARRKQEKSAVKAEQKAKG